MSGQKHEVFPLRLCGLLCFEHINWLNRITEKVPRRKEFPDKIKLCTENRQEASQIID